MASINIIKYHEKYMDKKEQIDYLISTSRFPDDAGVLSYRTDLSQMMDVVQRIGGSADYINSFGVEYREIGTNITSIQDFISHKTVDRSYIRGTPYVIFHGIGNAGHFHFIDKNGNYGDSYKKGWQNPGSNGFCQTFALMAALGETDVPYIDKHNRETTISLDKLSSKELCSRAACNFFLRNHVRWYRKYWKSLCKHLKYSNIKSLEPNDIIEDFTTSMFWPKGSGTMFWEVVLDQTVWESLI